MKIFLLLIAYCSLLIGHWSLVIPVRAAGSLGIVETYSISDTQATDGDILSNLSGRFVRATKEYDSNLFGVLVNEPLVVLRTAGEDQKPVVRGGITNVNVTATNGAIKNGDYLTSSTNPGKAMKATNSGYVLGIALEDLSGQEGKISVAVKIEYAELTVPRSANRLFEYLGSSFLANAKDPEKFGQVIRYISAGLVLLAAFGFSFLTFSRSLPKAMEAIGRNPLAKNTIYLSMALNVGLIAIVGVLGIAGALLILRL